MGWHPVQVKTKSPETLARTFSVKSLCKGHVRRPWLREMSLTQSSKEQDRVENLHLDSVWILRWIPQIWTWSKNAVRTYLCHFLCSSGRTQENIHEKENCHVTISVAMNELHSSEILELQQGQKVSKSTEKSHSCIQKELSHWWWLRLPQEVRESSYNMSFSLKLIPHSSGRF